MSVFIFSCPTLCPSLFSVVQPDGLVVWFLVRFTPRISDLEDSAHHHQHQLGHHKEEETADQDEWRPTSEVWDDIITSHSIEEDVEDRLVGVTLWCDHVG